MHKKQYRILLLPMKQLSRSVIFVDTNPKSKIIPVLMGKEMLSQLEDNDTDVFQKSLIDRYQHSPQCLQSMCLAEFAATYATNYQCNNDNECDALPPTDRETESKTITLTDGFGKMNKRKKKEAIIRFHKYNKDAEPSNWYRAKLMLYYPRYNEQRDLLGGYATYAEHYQSIVHTNEQKYSVVAILADIQDRCLQAANIICFCETWLTASQTSPSIPLALHCEPVFGWLKPTASC